MLPEFYQLIALGADLIFFLFVAYYLINLHIRERELEKKEKSLDKDYHHVVNNALSKERQIIDDATSEADKILLETQLMSESSQSSVDQALEALLTDLKKDSATAAETYRKAYQESLKQINDQSLRDFQSLSREMHANLQKQVITFHEAMLPTLEKELAAYKATRMQETETLIKKIVQQVTQEMLNKTLTIEDHEKILLVSLEKAKQKGMFA
ncbi:MAG: hypothetical protein ACR2LN_02250 [Candidatus Levyibacteriota bacterium]